MKAAFIRQTGPPGAIEFADFPEQPLAPGQVRIRTEAVAVNPVDTYVRSGTIAMDLPLPFIVGCDAAGTVIEVGSEVTGLRSGDRVWTTNQGLLGRQGTFAEQIVVDADWVYELPDGVPATTAAACALTGVTAHLGLTKAAARGGETILVIGGSGGVGSMVVQMAKLLGLTVITTAGSAEKAEQAKLLGADHVIEYYRESISERTRELAGSGVHLFWETRREPNFDMAIDLLAERGRMVLMAGRDARPPLPVGPFYVKECSLHGFVMFKGQPDELRQAAEDMNQWLGEGRLQAVIGATLPLAEAAEAHRLQESATLEGSGKLIGKIVLTPDG